MNRVQKHRGPDDEGSWATDYARPGHGAEFHFRRLSIIDTSPEGHQPMLDPLTGNVVVFNGEIYNYRELRRDLRNHGVEFQSMSDTEVLLKAYGHWGLNVFDKLRGMFAFAIWDRRSRRVVLARDRLGIKPLYFTRTGQSNRRSTIFFASELRSLLASGFVERRIDKSALHSYIWNGFIVGPNTICAKIEEFRPGTYSVIDDVGNIQNRRYWTYPRYCPSRNAIETLKGALTSSIQQHLVSDVPLAVFLSGGIDSSAISALAVKASGRGNLRTFNLSFDELAFDESKYAQAVADALGTQHSEVRLTQRLFKEQLNDALLSIDQPTFDAINSYFISRAVREAGITVALAGTGGDELFGGYSSFSDLPRVRRISQLLSILPKRTSKALGEVVARAVVRGEGAVTPQVRWGKLGDVLSTRGSMVDVYQTSYALFTQDFIAELTSESLELGHSYGLPAAKAEELRTSIYGLSSLQAISVLELANFIGERLLRDTDAASMNVSLEVRVPLLDHEVVEACINVSDRRRYHPIGRKELLRELALGELDKRLFDRPKSGFGMPIEAWSTGALRAELDETFADSQLCEQVGLNPMVVARLWHAFKRGSPGLYWSRIWALFVLLWWCRHYRLRL